MKYTHIKMVLYTLCTCVRFSSLQGCGCSTKKTFSAAAVLRFIWRKRRRKPLENSPASKTFKILVLFVFKAFVKNLLFLLSVVVLYAFILLSCKLNSNSQHEVFLPQTCVLECVSGYSTFVHFEH